MFKNNKIIKVIALTATIIFSSSSSAMALSHTVEKGDTLDKISRSYGVTLDNLRSTNNKWDDLIYPGQELTIPGQTISKNENENSKPVDENTKPIIAYSDKELDLLSRLIRAEAENQPFEAKVGVGAVVVNRVKSDKFPNDISSVIYEKNQFTPTMNGMINKPATEETVKAAKEALNGVDPTNGALFFFDTSAQSSWLWSKPQALKVDKMVFAY